MVKNRKKNNSGEMTATDQSAAIGITIGDATTTSTIATTDAGKDTIEIGMNEITPWITTGEGTTNEKETGISDATKREVIFAEKSAGKQPKNTTRNQGQAPRWSTGKPENGRKSLGNLCCRDWEYEQGRVKQQSKGIFLLLPKRWAL